MTNASVPNRSTLATQLLPQTVTQPKEEKTRLLAYTKWEQAGSPVGDDDRFWFEAENELIESEDFD